MSTVITFIALFALISLLVGLDIWASKDAFHPVPPHHDWFD